MNDIDGPQSYHSILSSFMMCRSNDVVVRVLFLGFDLKVSCSSSRRSSNGLFFEKGFVSTRYTEVYIRIFDIHFDIV